MVENTLVHQSAQEAAATAPPFEENDHCTILRATAEISDARVDYTLRIPHEITESHALLFVPGYLGIKASYDHYADAVALQGKPILSYKPPRDRSWRSAHIIDYIRHPEDLPCRAAYGVIKDARQRFGDIIDLSQVDGEGHSLGGRILARTALHHLGLFRATLFSAVAGIEDHTTLDFPSRIGKFISNELIPGFSVMRNNGMDPRALLDFMHYILKNPARTVAEGVAVSNCDLRPLLPKLHDTGVITIVRGFESDELTPNRNAKTDISPLVDLYEDHPNKALGHIAFQLYPDETAEHTVQLFRRVPELKTRNQPQLAATT